MNSLNQISRLNAKNKVHSMYHIIEHIFEMHLSDANIILRDYTIEIKICLEF